MVTQICNTTDIAVLFYMLSVFIFIYLSVRFIWYVTKYYLN